ncbi:hypothetical protein EDF64_11416 [Curtobacterium flaccumfaciens]|uniref:GRAM domain-containing protein n=1 Tax=Curtobacterium flaccumfaciens TaxID=2035 RepID=A0A4R6DBR9_9MICO|nr:hypothetical protein [Curtobacterium flaccumfaciens]TDN41937.1 hypothetical protein EDF64_11416 [Curtobacterium flaccumfaciens]
MNGSRGDAERERLDAALLAEEVVLSVAEAKTIIPSTKGLLAITAARVIYTSKRRSWTADLHQAATVSLTRERSRGTIRITSASHVEVFSAKWDAASDLVNVLLTQQAALAEASP